MHSQKFACVHAQPKTPLVLLPGSLCNARLFMPQIAYFQQSRDVYVMDFNSCDHIEQMAKYTLSLKLKSMDLLGLSMGGIAAFEIYRQAKQCIRSLILVDTNYLPETEQNKVVRLAQIEAVKQRGIEQVLDYIDTCYYPKYVAPEHQDNSAMQHCVKQMAIESGAQAFINQWRALISRPDNTQTLAEIACPTLIICGEQDQMCAVEKHQFIHQHTQYSTLKILKNCGHLSTLEQPDAFNAVLSNWLQSLSG